MNTHKVLSIGSVILLALVGVIIIAVFLASTYPINPQILDIDLPLKIQEKEVASDNFLTYETTFTQHRTLEATIITYLVPANSDEHIELTRTRTIIPETHNLRVRNNVFIPPGTTPGEYTLHIHLEYEWNRFRTVDIHLDSDIFAILKQEEDIQTPTEIRTFRGAQRQVSPEATKSPEPATIQLEGESTLRVVQTPQEPTPEPTSEPEDEPTPPPMSSEEPTPTPASASPLPCILLPILC